MTVILVSINQINIKTLSKHVIEGLTMVVDDGGMIPVATHDFKTLF